MMALAQEVDSENQQILLNSPGPSASQDSRGTQIVESQGSLSRLQVEVTVLRAHNIPHIKRAFGWKRQFFVTVTHLLKTRKTESVQIDGQTVRWGQRLGPFSTQLPSHLVLCLFEKRMARRDFVIGTQDISIPVASQSDVALVLSNGDGDAGQATHPVTLYLTFTVSANTPPLTIPNDPTKGDNAPVEEATKSSMAPDSRGPIQPTATEPLLLSPDPLSVETGSSVIDIQAEMSPTEKALVSLRRADEAKKPIDRAYTWKGAIRRIKWVMDTVRPIAELHPFAKMAYDLVLAIPEVHLFALWSEGNVGVRSRDITGHHETFTTHDYYYT